jgi:hypothetical protein
VAEIAQRKRKRGITDNDANTVASLSSSNSTINFNSSNIRLGSNEFVLQPSQTLLEEMIGQPITTTAGTGVNVNALIQSACIATGQGTGTSNPVSLLQSYWNSQSRHHSLTHLKSCGPREFAGRLPGFVYKW